MASQGTLENTLKDWFKKKKSFDEEYKAFSMKKKHLKMNFEDQHSPTHCQGVPMLCYNPKLHYPCLPGIRPTHCPSLPKPC
jgi:hypothetical protein